MARNVIAVIGHDPDAAEARKVRRVLRALDPRHAAALRAYMNREDVRLRDVEAAFDAFREAWAA